MRLRIKCGVKLTLFDHFIRKTHTNDFQDDVIRDAQ